MPCRWCGARIAFIIVYMTRLEGDTARFYGTKVLSKAVIAATEKGEANDLQTFLLCDASDTHLSGLYRPICERESDVCEHSCSYMRPHLSDSRGVGMTILRILLYVNLYVVGALVTYAVVNHFLPYDPKEDTWDEGDRNEIAGFLWPFFWIIAIIAIPVIGMSKAMDIIREMQKKK